MKEGTENSVQEDLQLRIKVEKSLLCALFLDYRALVEVAMLLKPEMFTEPDLGFIYQSCLAVYNRGERPDMLLVEMEMKKTDPERFRRTGGVDYLLDRMDKVRLESNALLYAQEIKRLYMLECLKKLLQEKILECNQQKTGYLDVIGKLEHGLLDMRESSRESAPLVPIAEVASGTIARHTYRMEQKDDPFRMLTGIRELDGITGGVYRGEAFVLGGLSSDGKTAVTMYMGMNVARRGHHVLHFSFEMTGDQTANRLFAGYAGVEAERLRIGGLRVADLEKMEKYTEQIKGLPYYFVNDPCLSLDTLRAQARLMQRKGMCDLIIVDYLHLLAHQPNKWETPESVISHCIRMLKALATELNCSVLVVSQLNRAVMGRKDKGFVPVLSDLRDSGTIEQVADNVVILHRPSRFGEPEKVDGVPTKNLIKLFVLKNRNGDTGVARVFHNDSFTNFWDINRELPFD